MYYEKILAYIDILGFSSAIKKTINENEEVEAETEKIFNLLEDIKNLNKDEDKASVTPISRKVVSNFSDSVAISYLKEEKAGVFHILIDILFLSCDILRKGYLFRGAITCGKLYHKQEKIFGPAMITAVNMEKKLAIYPRIILDEEIIAIAKENPAEYPSEKEQLRVINNFLSKDFDGLYYLNYFDAIDHIVTKEYGIPLYFKPLRKIIMEYQNEAEKDMSIKSKYLWLKEKYNNVLEKYKKAFNNEKTQDKYPDSYKYIKSVEKIEEHGEASPNLNQKPKEQTP
jgi:hypothetical protein